MLAGVLVGVLVGGLILAHQRARPPMMKDPLGPVGIGLWAGLVGIVSSLIVAWIWAASFGAPAQKPADTTQTAYQTSPKADTLGPATEPALETTQKTQPPAELPGLPPGQATADFEPPPEADPQAKPAVAAAKPETPPPAIIEAPAGPATYTATRQPSNQAGYRAYRVRINASGLDSLIVNIPRAAGGKPNVMVQLDGKVLSRQGANSGRFKIGQIPKNPSRAILTISIEIKGSEDARSITVETVPATPGGAMILAPSIWLLAIWRRARSFFSWQPKPKSRGYLISRIFSAA